MLIVKKQLAECIDDPINYQLNDTYKFFIRKCSFSKQIIRSIVYSVEL